MEENKIYLELTETEARHISHALNCTSSRNNHGTLTDILDTVEKVENLLDTRLKNGYSEFDTFRLLETLQEMTLLEPESENGISFSKFIRSGKLKEIHYDYGRGFYNVTMTAMTQKHKGEPKHIVRVWFGTIDDGDYGSWTEVESIEKAIEITKKIAEIFKDINELPGEEDLNKIFRHLGIYFCGE